MRKIWTVNTDSKRAPIQSHAVLCEHATFFVVVGYPFIVSKYSTWCDNGRDAANVSARARGEPEPFPCPERSPS